MGKKEVDVERTSKRSLLEKYDIPIENLSYEYITQCNNVKELERIIIILRSGEEGSYPDLTKHAEERLGTLKPESAVLRIAEPVIKRDMLAPEKRTKLENEINEWRNEMKLREKDLEEGRAMEMNEPIPQPDIRKANFDESKKKKQTSQNSQKRKRIAACDYAQWDKYDADTELNRIDLKHEQKQAEQKMAQKKLRDKEERLEKMSREAIIDKVTLTGTELSMMAEKEREKGNEAFKAGDYEEALQFYNSSLAIDATIKAYNNRAITYIKLQRYKDAVSDCNAVITMDYANVKALLRRGLALDHLEKRQQALADYEAVLKLEPSNRTAINFLNKLRGPCGSKKIRMKIEEESEGKERKKEILKDISSFKNLSNSEKNSKNLNSFTPNESKMKNRSEICFCDNAPTSSQYTSPRPHFKDVYCPKTLQSSKIVQKRDNIADIKIRSGKPSTVIIEEIPNDTWMDLEKSGKKVNFEKKEEKVKQCQKSKLTNFQNGDNSQIPKRRGVIIEEIVESSVEVKNEKTISKTPKKSTKFFNSDKEKENANKYPIIRVESSTDEKQVVMKKSEILVEKNSQEKCNPKIETIQEIKFDQIDSPYEFLRTWHSLKNDPDLILHAKLLKSLPAENINTVIGNKMDGEMLSTILSCFDRHFCTHDNVEQLTRFLLHLGKVKRFSLVTMFMDANDKKVLRRIFSFLEDQQVTGYVGDLRKLYDIPR